jgi:hypothetical protein
MPEGNQTKKPAQKTSQTSRSGRPAPKKPGKSIVKQKQRPWGVIITAIVLVLAAGGIVAFAVSRGSSGSGSNSAADDAKKIPGIIIKNEPNRQHVTSPVTYDTTPPIGGNHSGYWGDCTGTVYPNAIANENAVHMLEHGAVWITYNKNTIASGDLAKLTSLVQGRNGMAMSPYPDLKSPISLQFWGHQLFVDSASDPRVTRFIDDLLLNPDVTPEYGATCSQPSFKANPSTFGNPIWTAPAGGATMTPSR